jgi:hypothetical protein
VCTAAARVSDIAAFMSWYAYGFLCVCCLNVVLRMSTVLL